MAARGNIAKERLIKKFIGASGVRFLGEYDKKYYFEEDDGGERVQIALTLTCPKTFIDAPGAAAAAPSENLGDWDFGDEAPKPMAATKAEPAVITEQEVENIAELLKKLGL
jgi:hypothetical protein